jgi:hypothetical protein
MSTCRPPGGYFTVVTVRRRTASLYGEQNNANRTTPNALLATVSALLNRAGLEPEHLAYRLFVEPYDDFAVYVGGEGRSGGLLPGLIPFCPRALLRCDPCMPPRLLARYPARAGFSFWGLQPLRCHREPNRNASKALQRNLYMRRPGLQCPGPRGSLLNSFGQSVCPNNRVQPGCSPSLRTKVTAILAL